MELNGRIDERNERRVFLRRLSERFKVPYETLKAPKLGDKPHIKDECRIFFADDLGFKLVHYEWGLPRKGVLEIGLHFESNTNGRMFYDALMLSLDEIENETGMKIEHASPTKKDEKKLKWSKFYIEIEYSSLDGELENLALETMSKFIRGFHDRVIIIGERIQ